MVTPLRKLRPAAAAAALIVVASLALTGCGSKSGPTTTASTAGGPADMSQITVTDSGGKPSVKFAKLPFSVGSTTTRVLKEGTGTGLTTADIATTNIALYNGKTGALATSTFGQSPAGLYLGESGLLPCLKAGLTGQRIGARVLIAAPPSAGFGSTGNTTLKFGATDPLVFIVDVISATRMLTSATGTAVAPKAGLPTVTVTPGKAATVTIPKGVKPPTSLVVQPLIRGTGAVIKAGQIARVTYTGVLWRDGSKFDSSADHTDGYFEFPVGGGQVISGWDKGVVGQRVGSRLLLVVPPAEGYGAAGSAPKIKGTDTLVFVIDILAAY